MSLTPGIYSIRNQKTGYYILDTGSTSAGDRVATSKPEGDSLPPEFIFMIAKDMSEEGLYFITSPSGLSIAYYGKQAEDGNHYLIWREGMFKWKIEPADLGLWRIQLPTDAKFAADTFKIGRYVILLDDESSADTLWELISQEEP